MRGSESATKPPGFVGVGRAGELVLVARREPSPPGRGRRGRTVSASRKIGASSRGKMRSAAPKCAWPGTMLLNWPLTVRRPYGSSGLAIWLAPGPASSPPAACASARLICSRMNSRSAPLGSTACAAPALPSSVPTHNNAPTTARAANESLISTPLEIAASHPVRLASTICRNEDAGPSAESRMKSRRKLQREGAESCRNGVPKDSIRPGGTGTIAPAEPPYGARRRKFVLVRRFPGVSMPSSASGRKVLRRFSPPAPSGRPARRPGRRTARSKRWPSLMIASGEPSSSV